jgi:hypothetical protein
MSSRPHMPDVNAFNQVKLDPEQLLFENAYRSVKAGASTTLPIDLQFRVSHNLPKEFESKLVYEEVNQTMHIKVHDSNAFSPPIIVNRNQSNYAYGTIELERPQFFIDSKSGDAYRKLLNDDDIGSNIKRFKEFITFVCQKEFERAVDKIYKSPESEMNRVLRDADNRHRLILWSPRQGHAVVKTRHPSLQFQLSEVGREVNIALAEEPDYHQGWVSGINKIPVELYCTALNLRRDLFGHGDTGYDVFVEKRYGMPINTDLAFDEQSRTQLVQNQFAHGLKMMAQAMIIEIGIQPVIDFVGSDMGEMLENCRGLSSRLPKGGLEFFQRQGWMLPVNPIDFAEKIAEAVHTPVPQAAETRQPKA